MTKPATIGFILVAVLITCIYALFKRNTPASSNDGSAAELTLYCAAAFRKPVSQIVTSYTEETGRKVNIIYNGSGALLSQIKLGGGDLYFPANRAYVDAAAEAGLTTESMPAGSLTAVIVVHKDNTSIQSLEDLTKPGVRLSFANETAAIGQFARNILIKHGVYKNIEQNIIVTKPTVTNIIEDVALGSADATIAWNAVASTHPDLRIIEVTMLSNQPQETGIAILKTTGNHAAARHLAHYLTATKKAREVFTAHGFAVFPHSGPRADSRANRLIRSDTRGHQRFDVIGLDRDIRHQINVSIFTDEHIVL